MRSAAWEELRLNESDELLTTGEAAKLLGTSRQQVVLLCNRGDLPFVTTGHHRRVRRADVEALRSRTRKLTRDQLRSLWIGHSVAGRLVQDPEGVLSAARDNLEQLHSRHPRGQAARWLSEWEEILGGSIEGVLEALTSTSPRFRELRQNSPFAGVLGEQERAGVLDAFRRSSQR